MFLFIFAYCKQNNFTSIMMLQLKLNIVNSQVLRLKRQPNVIICTCHVGTTEEFSHGPELRRAHHAQCDKKKEVGGRYRELSLSL